MWNACPHPAVVLGLDADTARRSVSVCLVLLRQVQLGSSLGGPYLGVHLRRKDFIWGHREDVPSLDGAVKKIRSLMETHGLDKVFVATDAVRTGRPALPQSERLWSVSAWVWGSGQTRAWGPRSAGAREGRCI